MSLQQYSQFPLVESGKTDPISPKYLFPTSSSERKRQGYIQRGVKSSRRLEKI